MYSAPLPMVVLAFDAGAIRALYGARHELFAGVDIQVVAYPHMMMEQPVVKESIVLSQTYWRRNDGKAITVYALPVPIQIGTRLDGIRMLWNQFKMLYEAAIADPNVATVGIDTGTIMRRVAISNHLESLQNTVNGKDRVSLLQIEYGKPNDLCRSIYAVGQNVCEYAVMIGQQKNLIVTHHMEGVYANHLNSQTNTVESLPVMINGEQKEALSGLTDTYRYVDVALRMDKGTKAGKPRELVTVVEGEFMKCGYDLGLEHNKIENPTWDSLAEMINGNLAPQAQVKKRD